MIDQQVITMSERGISPYANQDAVFYTLHHTAKFFALADGMGGYKAGDVASHLTIETVYDTLREQLDVITDGVVLSQALEEAVRAANTAVYQYAINHDIVMGSTFTCAVVLGNNAIVANVGDSRTYLVRNGRLAQLTVDHSLVEHFVQQGIISEAERFSNLNNHIVTRGIGNEPDVEVDIFIVPLQENDQLLLCSDGLWGAFSDSDVVAELLVQDLEMTQIGQQIIQSAIDAGSNDHVSLVWAKLETI